MTMFFGPQIAAVPNGNKDMYIAIKGQGVTLGRSHVLKLRNCLTEFLDDAPPIVDDDKVEELKNAAYEALTSTARDPVSARHDRLTRALAAFDPPDPDTELVEKMAEWMANDWGAYSWTEAEPEAKDRWRKRARSLLNITRSQ